MVRPLDSSLADAFDALPGWGGSDEVVDIVRKVALFEGIDEYGRLQPLLGTVNDDWSATPKAWFQETTETPALGSTEIWKIDNFTGDAHPIHLHLVDFEVLDWIAFTHEVAGEVEVQQHNRTFGTARDIRNITLAAGALCPEGVVENSPRDMVRSLPGDPDEAQGQMVAFRASLPKAGRYS